MDDKAIQTFREKLESQHTFPGIYTFKFIVPVDQVSQVASLFDDHVELIEKESSKGNYKSITARVNVASSDYVINTYIEAKKIEGIISL